MSFFNDSFNYSLYEQMQDQIPAMNEFKQTSPQLQQYWFSIEIFGGRHSGGQLWNEVTALWNIYIYTIQTGVSFTFLWTCWFVVLMFYKWNEKTGFS